MVLKRNPPSVTGGVVVWPSDLPYLLCTVELALRCSTYYTTLSSVVNTCKQTPIETADSVRAHIPTLGYILASHLE